MKNKHMVFSILIATGAGLALLACSQAFGQDDAEESGGQPVLATAGEEAGDAAEERIPETLTHKDRAASAIMDVPLDGTSIDSFTAGLDKLDAEATEDEYRSVMSALDFLLFYDIGARRSKERLYARLNGKTPNEILAKVHNTRNQDRKSKK